MCIVSKRDLFLLLSSGYLFLLLQFVCDEQRPTDLYGLYGIGQRFLSGDWQRAGQQQLSGDHRLQKEGERRGWLEDIVRTHTCGEKMGEMKALTSTDKLFLAHARWHTHVYGPEPPAVDLGAGSTCNSRNQSRLWKREKTDLTSNSFIHVHCTEEDWECYMM